MAIKHVLQGILETAECDLRSYSGRGMMYGASCLAVDCDSTGSLFAIVLRQIRDDGVVGSDLEEIADAFDRMKTDSMGRNAIAYFPGIPYVAEEETESGEAAAS